MLDELFSYGTTTLDRLAFQKALDDHRRHRNRRLRLLVARAERRLLARRSSCSPTTCCTPRCPPPPSTIVKQQTAEFVAGRMKSPGYRADHALRMGLLPTNDPALRETTPETVSALTLDDVKAYHAATFRPDLTTIVVIGDVTAPQARATIEKWFGGWMASGEKPARRSAARAAECRVGDLRAGSGRRAGVRCAGPGGRRDEVRCRLLRAAAREPRARRRVLCHASVPRPPSGDGLRLHRGRQPDVRRRRGACTPSATDAIRRML